MIINSFVMDLGMFLLFVDILDVVCYFNYGLIIGVFFFSWFFGVFYIFKFLDSIGCKNVILICLFGVFVGYVLIIVVFYLNNFLFFVVG